MQMVFKISFSMKAPCQFKQELILLLKFLMSLRHDSAIVEDIQSCVFYFKADTV